MIGLSDKAQGLDKSGFSEVILDLAIMKKKAGGLVLVMFLLEVQY